MEDLFLFHYFVKTLSRLTIVDAIWTLLHVVCLCTSSRSDRGYGGVRGACSQWAGTSRIYFFSFGFKFLKVTMLPNRNFPCRQTKDISNQNGDKFGFVISRRDLLSVQLVSLCIRQTYGLLGCKRSDYIPRHLTLLDILRQIMAWVVLRVHEGYESSSESLVREAICWVTRIMLFNSQSNKVNQAEVNVLCSLVGWQESSA